MRFAALWPKRFGRRLAAALFVFLLAPAAAGQDSPNHFQPLQQKMLADDKSELSADFVNTVFSSPSLEFETKGISSYFRHRESKLNYDQFLSDRSIKNARNYMEKHKDTLTRAQEKFGVDKEIITAVALVETRLGTYTGRQKVVNILATMAALSDPDVRKAFWRQLPEKDRISRSRFESKADAKSEWAYRELKALLQYSSSQDMDPFKLKGSYAGALGIAQFMPSNILRLGEDGNKDGKIDLFDHEDAIFSIANYLDHYGWEPGISRARAKKVLHHYNHSSYYVNILTKISDRLKGES
ncbi:MAG: lytic murein transglycosylase [Thermodesulfobacteriota bacterium]